MLEVYWVQVYPVGDRVPYSMKFLAEDANHALEQYQDDPFDIGPVYRIDVYRSDFQNQDEDEGEVV